MGASSYAAFSLALLLICYSIAAHPNHCPECCNYGDTVVQNGKWHPGDIKKCLCSYGQWTQCQDYTKPDTNGNSNDYLPNKEYRPYKGHRPQQYNQSPRQYQPSRAPYKAAPPSYGGYRK